VDPETEGDPRPFVGGILPRAVIGERHNKKEVYKIQKVLQGEPKPQKPKQETNEETKQGIKETNQGTNEGITRGEPYLERGN
jgi:hypothetical protein